MSGIVLALSTVALAIIHWGIAPVTSAGMELEIHLYKRRD